MKVQTRIKTTIIILLAIALALTIFQTWHIYFRYDMKPKAYAYTQLENKYKYNQQDHSDFKKLVSAEFNTPHILRISSKGFGDNQYAKSSPMFRTVVMRNVQYGIDDVKAYAHELAHIKYQTRNECFATYKAIITLYESDNKFLKYVAIEYANDVLGGGYVGMQEDCGYYLLEYFKGETYI